MKRLTYKIVGDAVRRPRYCHGPGIMKDDLLQRLGKLEDIVSEVSLLMATVRTAAEVGDRDLLIRACDKVDETLKGAD